MEYYNTYLNPICNQAMLVFVVAIVALIKSLIDRHYVKFVALLIASVIAVMVLNCLCRSQCDYLAWLYAVLQALALLSAVRVIDLEVA